MPTTAVQFCNFLAITNDEPELREEGLPAFTPTIQRVCTLTPSTCIVAFKDQSFVLNDNHSLFEADDQEQFTELLLEWASKNPANRDAVIDFILDTLIGAQLQDQPQAPTQAPTQEF